VLAEWRALNPEYVESYKLSRRGPTERICRGCGEVFNREPGKREIGRFYCDDCRAAARIDSVGRLRTWDWERLRDEIIARDDGKCVRCGSTKDLQVHHKDWNHTNNDPSNLETICGECHRREHRVRWMPGEL
jgi:5-methylcytosine-specific restriction endonuclease McrA